MVTGGAGYVGSTLCRELLSAGCRVTVMDDLRYGGSALKGVFNHPNFTLRVGDIRKSADVEAFMGDDPSVVIHLAAIVGDRPCQLDPKEAVEVNYEGTALLAEHAKRHGIGLFLFASTCSNYGITDPSCAADEKAPLNPVSLYAETKIDCEKLLIEMHDERFRPVVLRFGTAYGVSGRTRFDLLVNSMTFEAVEKQGITVYAADTWRPYIHVLDMARVYLMAMRTPMERIGGEIINAGSNDQNFVKRDIASFVERALPNITVTVLDSVDDRRSYRVDFTKLEKLVGFKRRYSVKDGIAELIAAFRSGIITPEDYEGSRLRGLPW